MKEKREQHGTRISIRNRKSKYKKVQKESKNALEQNHMQKEQ